MMHIYFPLIPVSLVFPYELEAQEGFDVPLN